MANSERKAHWNTIYNTKETENCSWFQPVPATSLGFIAESGVSKKARIIDVGGGDSFLADRLLEEGYADITVLDISEAAIERAKKRLGKNAAKIKWIISDVADFIPAEKYDLWHDRAAFHFLTNEHDVNNYINTAKNAIVNSGTLIVGTFSEKGPKKCSGVEIKQYSQSDLQNAFQNGFRKLKCVNVDHPTPFSTTQNFTFCSFRKVE